jgi:uncharacterized protein YndB with AHSA1/START domain
MITEPTPSPNAARRERTYDAPAELIWELWTTAAGLGEWFAPDGFESRVSELELRPGGQLRYTMTATAPERVAFMRNTGNPLSAEVWQQHRAHRGNELDNLEAWCRLRKQARKQR